MAKKMDRRSGKTASKAGKVLKDQKSAKCKEPVTVSALVHALDKKKHR